MLYHEETNLWNFEHNINRNVESHLNIIFYSSLTYLRTYVRTYLLTPCSRVFHEELTDSQLFKKIPAFYATRRFVTAFTRTHHLSLSCAKSIQSTPPHSTSWRSILILSSPLRLFFPSGFPTKPLYVPLFSPIRAACPAYLILLNLIIRIMFDEDTTFTNIYIYIYIYIYIGCPRRNVPDFVRVFLMLKYTNITQNTYVQSWTVTEIMAREVWNFDSCYTLIDYQIHIRTGRNMWFL